MPILDFTKEKFDIIIQAGQSNSEGTAYGDVETAYIPKTEVWHLNEVWPFTGNYFFEVAREEICNNQMRSHYGFTFADEYLKAGRLEEGRKLLIVRTSIGGTGFLQNHWGLSDSLYIRMLDMIDSVLTMNPENRLVALLWHQGENDAAAGASFDTHYGNLSALVNAVRKKYNVPDLPFVAGDFVPQWKELEFVEACKNVVSAIRAVCDEPYSAFVETDGLLSNSQDEGNPNFGTFDTVHFCRKAIYELGRRYYAAFESIVNRK